MDQGLSFKLLLATEDIDDFLRGLGRLAVALRSDDTSYGISLRRDHRPMTATTIDARASHVDEIQPGHQMSQPRTLQTGDMVVVRDLAHEVGRLPDERPRAWPVPSARSTSGRPNCSSPQELGCPSADPGRETLADRPHHSWMNG